jgi:hypothetical protein
MESEEPKLPVVRSIAWLGLFCILGYQSLIGGGVYRAVIDIVPRSHLP